MQDVLRSKECIEKYKARKIERKGEEVDLMDIPSSKEWKYWRLVVNEFPYDLITSKHDMIVPKRKFANFDDMNRWEEWELADIKKELADDYDGFLESTISHRTVVSHYHLHCMKFLATSPELLYN